MLGWLKGYFFEILCEGCFGMVIVVVFVLVVIWMDCVNFNLILLLECEVWEFNKKFFESWDMIDVFFVFDCLV